MRGLPFLLISAIAAQAPQGRPTFTSGTDLVVVHVSVVDRQAGFVAGLPRESFAISEDGHPRPIAFFENEDTPVTVGMVIDSSQSMARRREAVIAAGLAFAESSHPDDELFTINFNERVWPGLPDGQPFTRDRAELRQALLRSTARGQTALFDALTAALGHLDGGSCARKILLVVSDGGDNASRARFEDVLDAALRHDVVIYTIGVADANDGDARPEVLKKLASVTGGEAFFPKKNEEITPALERIARDIRSSYTVGYVPGGEQNAAARRRIEVDVHAPDQRRVHVRARSLYVPQGAAR